MSSFYHALSAQAYAQEMKKNLQAKLKLDDEMWSEPLSVWFFYIGGVPIPLTPVPSSLFAISTCTMPFVRNSHRPMDAMQSSKARASNVYVVHVVVKAVPANYPQKDRNAKTRESALVLCLERILFQLAQKLDGDACIKGELRSDGKNV
ncbi:hypothetical protein PsorP6_010038 [Peronosclerospora sorghi]|uniref:Uncharacterized protein n=1 Tax=Peronosclerospora sorghi TaxID=230839 RepID=A0ACC0VU85_9STRA|nr:hypothetical protein PsorP6_010038 [Peronosclerospora sorghi]